jgi:IclR family transcriptional regulator, KDG regulon repressor
MEGKGVQVLDRALDIIELLSVERDGLGVTEIGVRLDLHKSTVHRLLSALAGRGYIERDDNRGAYRLGLKFIEIGSLRLNQLELKTEASPYLRRLADAAGQPVHLAILRGLDAVYIEKIDPVASIRMYSQIGKRIPVYCSALGKCLLSGLGKDELESALAGIEFTRFTAKTKTTVGDVRADIESAKWRGWGIDDEEHEDGIRCVAAPVRDYTGRIIAAVSVSGDRRIIAADRDAETAGVVMGTAAEISKRMGYVPGMEE